MYGLTEPDNKHTCSLGPYPSPFSRGGISKKVAKLEPYKPNQKQNQNMCQVNPEQLQKALTDRNFFSFILFAPLHDRDSNVVTSVTHLVGVVTQYGWSGIRGGDVVRMVRQ